MRFIYRTKLGLVLATIVLAFVVVAQARADQPAGTSGSTSVATASTPADPIATATTTGTGTQTTPIAGAPGGSSSGSSTGSTQPPPTTTTGAPLSASTNSGPASGSSPPAPGSGSGTPGPASGSGTPGPAGGTGTPPAGTGTQALPPDLTSSSPDPPSEPTPPAGPGGGTDSGTGSEPGTGNDSGSSTGQGSGTATPPQAAGPPVAPQPPDTPSSPIPIVSQTTTQTITQVEISGCLTNCQGVSQVQTAQQESVSAQILQTGGQLAGVTVPAGPGMALQSAGTITQIQIGCVAHCFDVSSSNPTTLATAQQLLAELDALLEPPAPLTMEPAPGAEQSVTNQTSCQEQDGQPSSLAQMQSASESSTTVQLVEQALPSLLGPSLGDSDPDQAVSQTLQSTWQLQIGCLLDCVASVQTQDADESSTTVEGVSAGPAGSDGGLEATVTQVIWQVQIGCLVWCYGSTQVQQASTENTVVLISAPAPGPGTPEPAPVSESGTSGSTPPASSPDLPPAPADPPPSSPPPSAAPAAPKRLRFPTVVGRSALVMVGALQRPGATTRPAVVTRYADSVAVEPVEWWRGSLRISRPSTAPRREHSVHPAAHVARARQVLRTRVLEARVGAGPGFAWPVLVLVLLAGALALATFARAEAGSDR